MSLKKRNVLFLDLQTTGSKPGTAHVLEIAWTCLFSEEVKSFLVSQPEGFSVPKRIQYITGIFEEDLEDAKSLSDVLGLLLEFIKKEFSLGSNPVAIIHFAQFEKPFLIDAFEKIEKDLPFEILCTHEIAKRLLPNLPTRGIKGLAGYFGFPAGELKRASNHVQATQIIWQGLTSVLAERGIHTLEELRQWLNETPKAARGKYEYPLPKEKRLHLPKQPGIYKMISKWGEVLYVGKATSLHDRVNSYFRGQKNRDPRKLEMLTQVWDLQVTPLGSPLEAALFETDEIKRLDPPYNISLKTGHRSLTFFNSDFTSSNNAYDEHHKIGPFSNSLVFDSMIRLRNSLESDVYDENMFFEPLNPDLIKEGFEFFCERHQFEKSRFTSLRTILAVGLNWFRKLKEETLEDQEIDSSSMLIAGETDNEGNASVSDNGNGNGDLDRGGTGAENDNKNILEEIELTPEDLADKFERHFIRAAKAYSRSKKLTQLLNADIFFKIKAKAKTEALLKIRHGHIVEEYSLVPPLRNWENLSVDTYDRMTVLYTELEKLKSQNNFVKIKRLHH
ncbi:MAG: exonuclease domain-containing protein [Bdellovibrio sp.]